MAQWRLYAEDSAADMARLLAWRGDVKVARLVPPARLSAETGAERITLSAAEDQIRKSRGRCLLVEGPNGGIGLVDGDAGSLKKHAEQVLARLSARATSGVEVIVPDRRFIERNKRALIDLLRLLPNVEGSNAVFTMGRAAGPVNLNRVAIARSSGEILGLAVAYQGQQNRLMKSSDSAYVAWNVVRPDQRGKGIGRFMLESVHAGAARQGLRRVYLDSLAAPQTQKFYQRFGAVPKRDRASDSSGVSRVRYEFLLPRPSAGLEEDARALRSAVEARQHPGGPVQMVVDAFVREKADVVVLSDPPSLELTAIRQPEYSAFLGGLVERLDADAGLDQIFIQLHPRVVEELMGFVRRWRESGIPDLWSFLKLYPDSVSVTHFVSGNLPSHWLDLFRVAAERGIPVIGIDPGEGIVDHRNRRIGDPKLQVFDEETARIMKDRVFSERRGKALVITDSHQAAGTPQLARLGRLLQERPGLNVVTVWVGVGEGFVTGNYDLYDTGLPVIAVADTTRSPLAEFALYSDLFSPGGEGRQAPVPVLASHFDRLVYFRSVRAIPVSASAPRAREKTGIRLSDLTFDEMKAVVGQRAPRSFVLHGSFERNTEALGLADAARAGAVFEEEAAALFGGNHRGQLYDVSFPDCVIVGHPAGLPSPYTAWSEPRTAAVFPAPRPVSPSAEESVWPRGWGFWPKPGDDLDPSVAAGEGSLRIFFTVSGLAVPPGLGSELPWAEGGSDLFTQEVQKGLTGHYLDGEGVSPRASRYIRQALAAEGSPTAEARFTPPSKTGALSAEEALGMVPINVTQKAGSDGRQYLEIRYEGRVPTKARYAGWYPFTAHLLQAGRWFRVQGEGQIQIQPSPAAEAPAGQAQRFESMAAFLDEYWLELGKQNLLGQVEPYREQAGRVLVFPRRAVEIGSVVHLLVQASPEARQTWSNVLEGRLRPDNHPDLNVDVKVAPYPADGKLPPGELSVVVRESGVPLPAPPTPAAPVVLISNVRDLGNVNAAWLCAIAVNEALRGVEVGPVLFVLPFRVGEEEYYAVMA